MIGPREPNHVKGEDLPFEVLRSPEADRQIDLPEREGSVPRDHTMKRQGVGS